MKSWFVAAALCFSAASVWAHHSLAAEYDQSKSIQLNGKMTKLDWRNPHAFIYIDAKMADGKIEQWKCELGSPNAMTRAGFAIDSVKVGDEVRLDGVLAKDGSKTCSTRTVSSPDGTVLLRQ